MYYFVSVAFTPIDDPDSPLTREQWRDRACMHVVRTDMAGFRFFHEWIASHGFLAINMEEFDAPVLPTDD